MLIEHRSSQKILAASLPVITIYKFFFQTSRGLGETRLASFRVDKTENLLTYFVNVVDTLLCF